MNWNEIKQNPEELANLTNEIGTRGVGDRFQKNKDTVVHWLKKHGYEYTNKKWEKDDDTFEKYLQEISDENIKVKKDNDTYTIYYQEQSATVSQDKLQQLYYDYCELNLTIEETAVKNNMVTDDFKIIKKAFDIIHDTLPLTDKEILEKSPEENIKEIIDKKKRKIKEQKPVEELRELRKIADKYYEQYYQAERILDNIENKIPSINYKPQQIDYEPQPKDLMITLSDLHYGKLVLSEHVLGIDEDYNKQTFKVRLNKYKEKIIEKINQLQPETIYVVYLGDLSDDPTAKTYPNQHFHQDVSQESQIFECADLLNKFILDISTYNPNIQIVILPGNHGDEIVNPDIVIGGIVERVLDFNVDVVKSPYQVLKIRDNNFIFSHGHFLRNGKNTKENDILNIIHSLNLHRSNTYLITAHTHHEEGEGSGYEHKQVPSLVGADGYAANKLNKFARAAQMGFAVEEDGLTDRFKVYFN